MDRLTRWIRTIARANITRVFIGIFGVMFLGGFLVLLFERAAHAPDFTSFWNAMWWALVTMTTVGYGDMVPHSAGGRLVGILVMFSGVTLVSLLTATISSIFVAQKIREGQGLEQIRMEGHIILCGWNMHAEKILDSLIRLRPKSELRIALINDLPEESVNEVLYKYQDIEMKFVRGDYTREVILERANIRKSSAVIIIPDIAHDDPRTADERTILATLAVKGLSNQIRVIAFLRDRENWSHLKRTNVDEIVLSDEFGGYLLASNALEPGVPQSVRELLDPKTDRNLHQREVPKEFLGKPFSEMFHHFYEMNSEIAIGLYTEEESISVLDFLSADTSALDAFIKRKLEESGHTAEQEEQLVRVNVNPPKDYVLRENDYIIVIGT